MATSTTTKQPDSGATVPEMITASVRRLTRAVDVHSRRLLVDHQITQPQATVLRAVSRFGAPTVGELARQVHLSQGTVTGIVDRLEHRGWLRRERDTRDRRVVLVHATEKGKQVLSDSPPLLHDKLGREVAKLPAWEQAAILSTLERLADMLTNDNHA